MHSKRVRRNDSHDEVDVKLVLESLAVHLYPVGFFESTEFRRNAFLSLIFCFSRFFIRANCFSMYLDVFA